MPNSFYSILFFFYISGIHIFLTLFSVAIGYGHDFNSINWKNDSIMEEIIDLIEKFLRGQMSQEEEGAFKKTLTTDAYLHSYAFIIMTIIVKTQKSE